MMPSVPNNANTQLIIIVVVLILTTFSLFKLKEEKSKNITNSRLH
ncbi:hypothetical protein J2S09_001531 [Bacillus fengqiuensis]|nr:hypothetical protein [Bacillus fengqiuensis]